MRKIDNRKPKNVDIRDLYDFTISEVDARFDDSHKKFNAQGKEICQKCGFVIESKMIFYDKKILDAGKIAYSTDGACERIRPICEGCGSEAYCFDCLQDSFCPECYEIRNMI
ncbi:hypothetical protein [Methanolobus sp.]|uniref:hypothetical protein n=1 Tax=Methanolobus sp. TaxID=1874737 RepID=UPI0025CF15A6|nr:hypothetical protein [Methanolobus sp.]